MHDKTDYVYHDRNKEMKHEPWLASETNLFKCGTRQVPKILHEKATRFKTKKRGGGTEIKYLSVTGAIWTKDYGTLSVFRRVRRLLVWSCLYDRPHGTTRLPLDGFSWNLIFESFSKNMSIKFNFYSNLIRITGTLTLRRLMSYIYGTPILDVSRSHTTTHHSR